jgi:hypothetical protein
MLGMIRLIGLIQTDSNVEHFRRALPNNRDAMIFGLSTSAVTHVLTAMFRAPHLLARLKGIGPRPFGNLTIFNSGSLEQRKSGPESLRLRERQEIMIEWQDATNRTPTI